MEAAKPKQARGTTLGIVTCQNCSQGFEVRWNWSLITEGADEVKHYSLDQSFCCPGCDCEGEYHIEDSHNYAQIPGAMESVIRYNKLVKVWRQQGIS